MKKSRIQNLCLYFGAVLGAGVLTLISESMIPRRELDAFFLVAAFAVIKADLVWLISSIVIILVLRSTYKNGVSFKNRVWMVLIYWILVFGSTYFICVVSTHTLIRDFEANTYV